MYFFLVAPQLHKETIHHRPCVRCRTHTQRTNPLPYWNNIRRRWGTARPRRTIGHIHSFGWWSRICTLSTATTWEFVNCWGDSGQGEGGWFIEGGRTTAQFAGFGNAFCTISTEVGSGGLVHIKNIRVWIVFGKLKIDVKLL